MQRQAANLIWLIFISFTIIDDVTVARRRIYNDRYIRVNGQVRIQLSLGDATHYGGGNPGLERPGYHQIPLCGKSQLPFSRGGKSHGAFLAERDSMVAGGFNLATEGEAVMRS